MTPLRMSMRPVTHRLSSVSALGRRSIAATTPSSAMTSAGAPEPRSAGTVDQWPKNLACAQLYGNPWAIPIPDVARTDLLVVMGANPQASNGSLLSYPDLIGEITRIRRYCETDVVNTWLVYLRFQHMRGRLTDQGLDEELARTRAWLTEAKQPHFDEFLAAWSAGA